MKVVKNSIVTLKYSVTDPDGAMVDDGQEPLIYLHGGHDDIFPKIEEALEGKELNETVKVRLQADEAFGEYDAELVQIESRADLPEELELGMELEGGPEDGGEGDDDFVIYRKKTGALFLDTDGSGPEAMHKIAILANKVKIDAGDIVV